jgi:predicted anti-sigma-YlaC factor YlaD
MIGGHDDVRPLLAARPGELNGVQARWVADHLATCQACGAEAETYRRLFRGLAALAGVELEPPPGLLDRLLATTARRRHGTLVVVAAAGSAGALVAGVVVARAIQQRRRSAVLQLASTTRNPVAAVLRPAASLPAGAGEAIRDAARNGVRAARAGRWWRLRPA